MTNERRRWSRRVTTPTKWAAHLRTAHLNVRDTHHQYTQSLTADDLHGDPNQPIHIVPDIAIDNPEPP